MLGPVLYIWVQGCPRACPGCANEGAWRQEGAWRILGPGELVEHALEQPGGIVLSGGEPMEQAAALAETCRFLRASREDVEIMCYTGYRLEELLSGGCGERMDLLKQVDVLIDGAFDMDAVSNTPLVGSTNQRVFLLSPRVDRQRLLALSGSEVQVSMDEQNRIRLVGAGSAGSGMTRAIEAMQRRGITIEEGGQNA